MNFVDGGIVKSSLSIMKSFGIAELERLCGIKAHTIRTWEQRFGICKPARTDGNFRLYSLDQLQYILSLALLNRNGFKIAKLSKLSLRELDDKLASINDVDCHYEIAINKLLFYMYSLNGDGFEKELSQCFLKWTASIVIICIIQPFLKLTSLEWKGSRLAEEHLVVTILRSKLLHSIEEIVVATQKNKLVLLFLEDAQDLDLSLLCVHYRLKQEGLKVIYMGNNVSIENLSILFHASAPDYVYTYLPAKVKLHVEKLASILDKKVLKGKIIITCPAGEQEIACSLESIIVTDIEGALQLMLQ